ncbi:SDR family oxidoreductase [Streptomyces sp. ODS28]|uniref:SDR family oxidoreductase n=1 Tax=Streptomyces sp. ODS28 TaxID=3136688 RepID=UPI0031EF3395
MGTFAITGTASGMGAASAERLRAAGHEVIGVDLREAEVTADLGTAEGRRYAVEQVLSLCGGTLDGVAAVAGVGPSLPDAGAVVAINYYGTVQVLEGLRPALEHSGTGRAVAITSNSATTVPLIDEALVDLLLDGDGDRGGDEAAARKHAVQAAREAERVLPSEQLAIAPSVSAYASSKFALARWVRGTAVTAPWARTGTLLNAIAPGAVLTPLMIGSTAADGTEEELDPGSFPTPMPLGTFGRPEDIAFWVEQFLRPEARFTTGSVLCVDGGTEAAMRPDAQPTPLRA